MLPLSHGFFFSETCTSINIIFFRGHHLTMDLVHIFLKGQILFSPTVSVYAIVDGPLLQSATKSLCLMVNVTTRFTISLSLLAIRLSFFTHIYIVTTKSFSCIAGSGDLTPILCGTLRLTLLRLPNIVVWKGCQIHFCFPEVRDIL